MLQLAKVAPKDQDLQELRRPDGSAGLWWGLGLGLVGFGGLGFRSPEGPWHLMMASGGKKESFSTSLKGSKGSSGVWLGLGGWGLGFGARAIW